LADLQAKWRTAADKVAALKDQLRAKYGNWIWAPAWTCDRVNRLSLAESKAQDRIIEWLEEYSPRGWRTGIPCHWLCTDLTEADALTAGPLSVVPPPAYGSTEADSRRFALAVSPVAA
jgi:hypothetical protein